MITCLLKGGLGNQLFQIAATYALALRNNDIIGIDTDHVHLPGQGNPPSKYVATMYRRIPETNISAFKFKVFEPMYSYQPLPYNNWIILDGYFQSEKYFTDFKTEVLELFNMSRQEEVKLLKIILGHKITLGKSLTSVHVRRGDYLNQPAFHPTCSVEYYKEAMARIGDSNFIFISDDMDWVKANFAGENIFYSDLNDDYMELRLMSMCRNNIIANSSFSWWGAYLKPSDLKQVIAPKIWFGPNGPQDTHTLLPDSWITL